MRIAVIGTGYVGLVTGVCLAETGNSIICVDNNKKKIEQLKNSILPIYEPNLKTLFERNLNENKLEFTASLDEGIADAEIIFLALPTPSGEDGSADLNYVLDASELIAKSIKSYKIIVTKSTVPVGTAEKIDVIFKKNCLTDYDIVSNPEFLREGKAIDDFMKPDRIVIGTQSKRVKKVLSQLYEPYVVQGNPIFFMDWYSSEMTKYAANSFLATKISFMNEIANLCEKVGADVSWVRKGIGTDSRIGAKFLYPGIGFGGSCFPKDVLALTKTSDDVGYNFKILNSVLEVNRLQKQVIFEKINTYYNKNLKGKTFAIWGASFKPETDDIRYAPSIDTINNLLVAGAKVKIYDPVALQNLEKEFGDKITYQDNMYKVLESSDALVIMTEWLEFRNPDFEKMGNLLKEKIIFDGRNMFSPQKMKELNFYYKGIGRKEL